MQETGYFREVLHISSVVWTEAQKAFDFGSVLWHRVSIDCGNYLRMGSDAFTTHNIAQKGYFLTEKLTFAWVDFEIGFFEPLKHLAWAL